MYQTVSKNQAKFSNIQENIANILMNAGKNVCGLTQRQLDYTIQKPDIDEQFKQDFQTSFIDRFMGGHKPCIRVHYTGRNFENVPLDYRFESEHAAVMDAFIALDNKCPEIHCSQEYISEKTGVSIFNVNRIIKELCEVGLLKKKYRSRGLKFKTDIYKVADYFKVWENRQSLKHIFNSLAFFCITMLTTPVDASDRILGGIRKTRFEERSLIINNSNIKSQLQEINVINAVHFTEKTKLQDIYPYLSSNIARAVAVKCKLTPFKAAWLAQVPNDILCRAYEKLFYAMKYKKPVQSISGYLCGNILAMCKSSGIVVNYALVPATVSMYGLDTNWTKLSMQEHVSLENRIKRIGELYTIAIQEHWDSNKKNKELKEKKTAKVRPYCAFNTYPEHAEDYVDSYDSEKSLPSLSTVSTTKTQKKESSISIKTPTSANPPKQTIVVNDSPALGPTPQEQCKLDIEKLRIAISNAPFDMRAMFRRNFSNDLKFKFPFLPADFDILDDKSYDAAPYS